MSFAGGPAIASELVSVPSCLLSYKSSCHLHNHHPFFTITLSLCQIAPSLSTHSLPPFSVFLHTTTRDPGKPLLEDNASP